MKRVISPVGFVLLMFLLSPVVAEDAPKTGVVEGTSLSWPTGKFIMVWADDEDEPVKLRPRWVEGEGEEKGKYEQAVFDQLKEIDEGSRVRVAWIEEKGPRIVSIKVVEPADTEGGTARGKVIETQRTSLIVRTEAGPVLRFSPKWVPGEGDEKGHLDETMLEQVKATPVGSMVEIEWTYDQRPRIESMTVTPPDDAK